MAKYDLYITKCHHPVNPDRDDDRGHYTSDTYSNDKEAVRMLREAARGLLGKYTKLDCEVRCLERLVESFAVTKRAEDEVVEGYEPARAPYRPRRKRC